MITKVCQFKARQEQGERLVQIFQPGEMEKAAAFFSMGKQAAPMLPQVQAYLDKLKPHPTKIYVLVNALGAGEFWGSNINGDYFPEGALIHDGMDYGYKTFYNAFPYKHHVNKDPSKSFGKVELVCWNVDMRRVELVVSIDRELAKRFAAQDVVDKLDQNMFPDVSMGCRVPYDLCSKCLDWNKYRKAQSTFNPLIHESVGKAVLAFHKKDPIRGLSVTRNDYCDHLRTMLNKILEDGVKVYAINDYPKFFDISFVFIGADKTAKVMAKLAMAYPECGEGIVVPSWYVAEQLGYDQPATEKDFEKTAGKWGQVLKEFSTPKVVGKVADTTGTKLEKKRKATPVELVRAMLKEKKASQLKGAEIIKDVVPSFGSKAVPIGPKPDLPNSILDRLGKSDLSQALSTPTSMGMLLKPREFQRITIIRLGKKPLADELDRNNQVFSPTEESDSSVPMGPGHFSSNLMKMLLPMLGDQSCFEPVVKRKVVRITISPEALQERDPEVVENDGFLQKISAAYNGYLDQVVDCLKGSEEIVDQHPELWESVHGEGLADGFQKVAAGGKVSPKVLFGTIGAAYFASELAKWERRKAMMGKREPVGHALDTIAENPKAFMLLAGIGALEQQGSSIPRRLLAGLKGVVKRPL